MKILVTGARGMLGSDLVQQLSGRHQVIAVDVEDVDVRKEEMAAFVEQERPGFVFHLAAYTRVDRAEDETELAAAINVGGTRNVVNGCKSMNIPLLFVSTDYVFDGKRTVPYVETDDPNPMNAYGNTKREAEKIIIDELSRWFIIRTGWLFGTHGKNFVDTIIQLAGERDHLEVVDDQQGTPTYTKDLAHALELFIEDQGYGTYHIANKGNCTWFDFANEIVSLIGAAVAVRPVSSEKMGRPARRPAYSVLDTGLFEDHFGYRMPTWRDGLRRYLEERSEDGGA